MTISELFEECWKGHWDCERFHLSGHAKEVRSKYENHIKPKFGEREYLELKRSEIRDWHQGFREKQVTGNRLLEILSSLYRFSADKEWNEQGFNPVTGVKRFTERKRRRYANEREIKKIGEILDRLYLSYPLEITFIYTLMFTGARPRSIERATWNELQELDDGFGLLTFEGKSTEKTGDQESVIIPPNIMKLIFSLPRRSDGLIFRIKLPSYLWRKIRTEAGCPDLWCRDSRRTFATVGFSDNIEMSIIGELLNHHSVQTTKTYAKLNNKARLGAVSQISSKLNSILKK